MTVTNHISNAIGYITDTFGVVLPVTVLIVGILAIIYNDRVVFTPGERKEAPTLPGALPLIGHTYLLVTRGTAKQYHRFQEMAQITGTGAYRISAFGAGSIIMINRPEYLEYVQKTNFENYEKGSQIRDKLGDLLGNDGIFVADGHTWKTQRKLASHMFSASKFNTWVRQVVHNELNTIDGLLDNIADQRLFIIDKESSLRSTAANRQNLIGKSGGAIGLPDLFFRYTLSSFANMAFAADMQCLSEDPQSLNKPHPFATAFDYAQSVVNNRFVLPWWRLKEVFSQEGKDMRKAISIVRGFATAIIKQRLIRQGIDIQNVRADDEKSSQQFSSTDLEQSTLQNEGKDLLALFMEQTHDPQALLTVVLNFMIAGRDTTAQTLSWLFYELSAHPEHVQAIREELDAVLGSDATAKRAWIGYDDVKRLPYTLACVHEALRLHPAVPKNAKGALRDDVIVPPGPNPENLPPIKVYAGERIGWSDWVLNRQKEVWGEDAEQFRPQRFLTRGADDSWQYVQQSEWKFHAFNAGYRRCLGINLAGYEAVAFVAATLQKFDFTWANTAQGQTSVWPPEYANSVTHPMKGNFQCIVTSRV